MLSDFRLYYEAVKSKQYDIGIKRSMAQNRQLKINPHIIWAVNLQ